VALWLAVPAAAAPLTLPELVARARQNDIRVREAEAELHELQGKYREAFWAWFPKFETTVALAGPTPEAHNDGLGGPPTTPASYTWDTNLGRLGVMFRSEINGFVPLYTFGKLSALREAGEQGVLAGENLRERAQDQAAVQAAEAFFAYQLAREGIETLQVTLDALNSAAKLVDQLLKQESAQVTTLDRFKLQYYRRSVEARIGQADAGMRVAVDALRVLIGVPHPEELEIAPVDLEPVNLKLPKVEGLVDTATRLRPEVRAIRAGVHASEREVLIRERSYYPDFGLLGFARFAYTTSATRQRSPFAYDPYNQLDGGLALVVRVTFDIPVKSAQLDQAQARLEKVRAQQDLLLAGVGLEVRKLHTDFQEAQQRAKAYADAERSARQWATAAYANFEVGTGDTRELVDAYTAFALASAERLKGCYDLQVGIRELARAVGSDELVGLLRPSGALH
jgi:outer membrane protein TolC